MRWVLIGVSVLWMPLVWAAPDLTMTVAPTASSGATITASDENTRNNVVANAYNSHTHTDITQTGTALNIGASSGRSSISDASVVLEGATNNDFEATLSFTDPTVDSTLAINANNLTATRTLTVPNESGNLVTFTNANTQDVNLIFEGATANDFETTLTFTDPTSDFTITMPNAAGTVVLTASSPSLALVTLTTAGPATPAANTLYTDNIVKGWCYFADGGTAAITDDFNAASIADNGTGDYTITWETDLANANYVVAGTATDATTPDFILVEISRTAGTTRVGVSNSGGTAVDATSGASVLVIGD